MAQAYKTKRASEHVIDMNVCNSSTNSERAGGERNGPAKFVAPSPPKRRQSTRQLTQLDTALPDSPARCNYSRADTPTSECSYYIQQEPEDIPFMPDLSLTRNYSRSPSISQVSSRASTVSISSLPSSDSLDSQTEHSSAFSTPHSSSRNLLGLSMCSPRSRSGSVSSLTSVLSSPPRGVVVTTVKPGSMCAHGGVREGDIITHVNDLAVFDAKDMEELLRKLDLVSVTVRRRGVDGQPDTVFTVTANQKANTGALSPLREEGSTPPKGSSPVGGSPKGASEKKALPLGGFARKPLSNAFSQLSDRTRASQGPQAGKPMEHGKENKLPMAAPPSQLDTMEARLLHFYKTHSPMELKPGYLSQVCGAYEGDEDALWKNLGQVHGVEKVLPYRLYQKATAAAKATKKT
eukprot:g68357.t1